MRSSAIVMMLCLCETDTVKIPKLPQTGKGKSIDTKGGSGNIEVVVLTIISKSAHL